MFQTRRGATNNTNRRLSSLKKKHDLPNSSSGNEQFNTFLPEENNTGTSTTEAIQIRKQFFNCNLSGSF